MSDKKDDVISKAYHEFYGSAVDTYHQVKKQDPTIKLQDVKNWFERNFIWKTNLRGFNRYIAQKPHQEYQIDSFFMPETDGEEYQIVW